MSHYPHLFSPLTINGMTLKPHYYAPMGTNMATLNGEVSQEQLEYYELRAKGGTGLITIENICIDFPSPPTAPPNCASITINIFHGCLN
nr:NADH oxidase [Klebsiella pneumoniae]